MRRAGDALDHGATQAESHRNPGSKQKERKSFPELHGSSKFIWLKGGIAGGDTDGHIDNLARFVRAGTVVCAYEEDSRDENHAAPQKLQRTPAFSIKVENF
jgi:agmatine deiminase